MNLLIQINYIGRESDITQKGNFKVNTNKFKEDPDHTAAYVAHQWINEFRRQRKVSEVLKVTYNDIDITYMVKELDHF